MIERKCENCVFWDPSTPDSLWGLCRKEPPKLIPGNDKLWLSTTKYDWCGEFKPREEQGT